MKFHYIAVTLLGCGAMSVAGAVLAHVTANPDEGAAGSYFRTALRVSHGCEGSPTVALRVEIPEDIHWVKPQAKPGWDITVNKRELDEPVTTGELTLNETVEEVVWHGGRLSAAHFDEFGLTMKLPPGAERTVYLPTMQQCVDGANDWTAIPESGQQWHDIDGPAPFIQLIEEGHDHH